MALDFLLEVIRVRASDQGRAWLERAVGELSTAPAEATLLRAYTAAGRHVGKAPLELAPAERRTLLDIDAELPLTTWTAADAARAALLLAVARGAAGAAFAPLALACYQQGDSREQQSWLRALPLLPSPERFLASAIDSCRTNIVPQFEAIACENPYPARFFPDLNFNQMVLKALFNSIAMFRIVGLERRLNPELSRMAAAYASERRVAGRSVPPDIDAAIGPAAEEIR